MSAYYNEIDPFAAQWLRNLIAKNLIAPGDVDERSILDVQPDDLLGYEQCHFFAGIGGWSYALRLAGWPDDEPVWTGSCPCQPYSVAGKRKGKEDSRHLWPDWLRLIRKRKPPVLFGEQVASAIAHGWLDDVYQGLEGEDYAIGSAVLPACGVGQAHRRDRLWFVAESSRERSQWTGDVLRSCKDTDSHGERASDQPKRTSQSGFMANPNSPRPSAGSTAPTSLGYGNTAIADGWNSLMENSQRAESARLGQHGRQGICKQEAEGFAGSGRGSSGRGDFEWLLCADQKQRPVEPSIPLLAHGVSNRVGKLRGFGNAIVAALAAEFIQAYRECRP